MPTQQIVDIAFGLAVMGTVGTLIGFIMGESLMPVAAGLGLVLGGVISFIPFVCFVGIPLAIIGFILLLVGAVMEGPQPMYAVPMPYAAPPYGYGPYPGQPAYPGQAPYPVQPQYPGQPQYPVQPPATATAQADTAQQPTQAAPAAPQAAPVCPRCG